MRRCVPEFASLRNRAARSASMLEPIMVYFFCWMPTAAARRINQVVTASTPRTRRSLFNVWDKGCRHKKVEKAIRESVLGSPSVERHHHYAADPRAGTKSAGHRLTKGCVNMPKSGTAFRFVNVRREAWTRSKESKARWHSKTTRKVWEGEVQNQDQQVHGPIDEQ